LVNTFKEDENGKEGGNQNTGGRVFTSTPIHEKSFDEVSPVLEGDEGGRKTEEKMGEASKEVFKQPISMIRNQGNGVIAVRRGVSKGVEDDYRLPALRRGHP
jgi:hypothetical protein